MRTYIQYMCLCVRMLMRMFMRMLMLTPRVERGSPELTGPGRVVCVAGRPSQEPAALCRLFLRLWCPSVHGCWARGDAVT